MREAAREVLISWIWRRLPTKLLSSAGRWPRGLALAPMCAVYGGGGVRRGLRHMGSVRAPAW